jgi:GTPase-associated system helical domain
MAGYNFADSYRAAALAPGPEVIKLRQEPFEKICEDLDEKRAIDLTRLFFGLEKALPDWFREPFAAADPSFSPVDNEREIAVLASCGLAVGIEEGIIAAALAPLTAGAAGNRKPLVRPSLLNDALQAFQGMAGSGRGKLVVNTSKIADANTKLQKGIEGAGGGPDAAKSLELFRHVIEETNAVAAAVGPLIEHVVKLDEEVNMLWWYFGGWSRALERPFRELAPPLAAAMAGLDLATLTTAPGPLAAPAVLHRVIGPEGGKGKRYSIREAVDAEKTETYARLGLPKQLELVPDICPVLTAFKKAVEIGETPAWHGPFAKASKMEASSEFSHLDLALQVYRETLLVSLLA